MSRSDLVSIVIPTYNHLDDLLKPCVESIERFTSLYSRAEVVVVANGCTDGTAKFIRSNSAVARPVVVKEAIGFPRAVNAGIAASRGDFIVVLNNDTLLLQQERDQWLDMLLAPFKSDPAVGVTGPMMAANVPGVDRKFLIFFCAMFSRSVVEKVGLLDESFSPGFGEDCDYCWRAEDAGFKLVQVPDDSTFEPQAQFRVGGFPIYHRGNVTFSKLEGAGAAFDRNHAKLRSKYGSGRGLVLDRALKADGYMNEPELEWLAGQAREHVDILEVGSWHGRSTRALGDNTAGRVTAVDHWLGSEAERDSNHASARLSGGDHAFMEFCRNNDDLIASGKVVPMRMRGANAYETFRASGRKFDMIFIDAGHQRDEVCADLAGCLPLLKDGGLLCGHDYGAWAGVNEAVDDFMRDKGGLDGAHQTIWFKKFNEAPAKRRVYDCFIFFNELELLHLRLNELKDVVDYFVIVEAGITFQNQRRDLVLERELAEGRLEAFRDKIRYIVADSLPEGDAWAKENAQRRLLDKGLTDCRAGDLILISDADEIPSAAAVSSYDPSMGLRGFDQKLYYYWLNCYSQPWDWAKVLSFEEYVRLGRDPQRVRYEKCEVLSAVPGGWHFSFQGGVDRIIEKVSSWAHSEYNRPDITDRAHVLECVETPRDVLNRPNILMHFVELDDSFPRYVLDNVGTIFKDWVYPMQEKKAKKRHTRGKNWNEVMAKLGRSAAEGVQPVVEVKDPPVRRGSVTAYVSTKDRYFSSLPLAIESVAHQTVKPTKFVMYDDGEQKDLSKEPLYSRLFKLLQLNGINWEVRFTPRQGQVRNHQHMVDTCETEFLWRLDDDNVAEPGVLEELTAYMADDEVGAVGGVVVDPGMEIVTDPATASSKIEDVYLGANAQWFKYSNPEPFEVDHLYSSFLYRKAAAKHGYCLKLSPVGHREETIFTYEMKRAGWKLLVCPGAVTWHMRNDQGGIRSHGDGRLWNQDEDLFRSLMASWGVQPRKFLVMVDETGIGDHYALKEAMPKILEANVGKVPLLYCTFPKVFFDDKWANGGGVKIGSVAEAKLILGDIGRFNVYSFMGANHWSGKLRDAYAQLYGVNRDA